MRNIFSIICLNRKIIFYHLMSSLKCFVSVMVFPVAGPPGSLYLPAPSALNTRSELCTQQIAFSFGKQSVPLSSPSMSGLYNYLLSNLMTKDILHRTRYLSKQQTKQDLDIDFFIGNILIIFHRETNTFITREERNRLFSKEGIFTTPERGNKVTLTECGA